MRIGRGVK
ncbi:hypothetical protein YPPY47_0482, partial [Yersinia pestis PY-47]